MLVKVFQTFSTFFLFSKLRFPHDFRLSFSCSLTLLQEKDLLLFLLSRSRVGSRAHYFSLSKRTHLTHDGTFPSVPHSLWRRSSRRTWAKLLLLVSWFGFIFLYFEIDFPIKLFLLCTILFFWLFRGGKLEIFTSFSSFTALKCFQNGPKSSLFSRRNTHVASAPFPHTHTLTDTRAVWGKNGKKRIFLLMA